MAQALTQIQLNLIEQMRRRHCERLNPLALVGLMSLQQANHIAYAYNNDIPALLATVKALQEALNNVQAESASCGCLEEPEEHTQDDLDIVTDRMKLLAGGVYSAVNQLQAAVTEAKAAGLAVEIYADEEGESAGEWTAKVYLPL